MVPARSRAEVVLRCGDDEVASWPLVCRDGPVDLAVVEELARALLEARRQGCAIQVRRAGPDLVALLRLVGLCGLLQVSGETEGLEQGGVEEVVVTDDPVP